MQKFVDRMNVTKEPEELHQLANMQKNLQSSLERASASALYRLEHLIEKEETKSNSLRGSRKSKYSQRSIRSTSPSKGALLGIKARRAALEQKLKVSGTIKEQEKTLAKLKIQQKLSETVTEEAVYQEALLEELIPQLPTGLVNIVDR